MKYLFLCFIFVVASFDCMGFTVGNFSYYPNREDSTKVSVSVVDKEAVGKSVIIPETVKYEGVEYRVTAVGRMAFSWCSELETVILPNTIEVIDQDAFSSTSSLTRIELGNSLLELVAHAFYKSGIREISLPNTLKYIGDGCFAGSRLEKISIPNSVVSIDSNAFGCRCLKEIYIGSGLKKLANDAFACDSLINVTVSDENRLFKDDNGILFNKNKTELILFPAGRKGIDYIVPETVKKILPYSFYYCDLKKLDLNQVTMVESKGLSFSSFSSLNLVPVTQFGWVALWGCKIDEVSLDRLMTLSTSWCSTSDFNKIKSYAMTPRALNYQEYQFNVYTIENAILQVPLGTKETYESTDGWNQFSHIEEFDSISDKIESMKLNFTDLELSVGDELTLRVTISPAEMADTPLTWTSSNEECVTVSSTGRIKAIASGEADVTATIGAKSVTCKVKVIGDDSGIDDVLTDGIKIEVIGNAIRVQGANNKPIKLYNAYGQLVYSGYDGEIEYLTSGFYILRIDKKSYKIMIH